MPKTRRSGQLDFGEISALSRAHFDPFAQTQRRDRVFAPKPGRFANLCAAKGNAGGSPEHCENEDTDPHQHASPRDLCPRVVVLVCVVGQVRALFVGCRLDGCVGHGLSCQRFDMF